MTRKEIAKLLALKHGFTADGIDDVLDTFFEIVSNTLASGQEVKLTNFGKFEPRQRAAGIRRNPRTGEKVDVGPRTSVGFKASTKLREKLNENN